MKHITQEEWKKRAASDDNAVILDVRTQQECSQGILEGARCMDLYKKDIFIAELEKMDKSKNYFLYCRSGQRSASACLVMDSLGFKNTYSLLGGISEWNGKITSL